MGEVWPPEHAWLLTSFQVSGDPKGAGSKNAIPLGRWIVDNGRRCFRPVCRDGGVPVVNVVDSAGKDGDAWSEEIRTACARALDVAHDLHDGPIAVRATFYGASPKGRYGTGRNAARLKASADRLPHRSELPDGTKLARRLEDALNGLCWTDDRRVCDLWWSRRFGRWPGARVDVYGMPARFSDVHGGLPGDQLVIIPSDGSDDGHTDGGPSDFLLERAGRAVGALSVDQRDGGGPAARDQSAELQA